MLINKLYKKGIISPSGIFRLSSAIISEGMNLMTLLSWAAKIRKQKATISDENQTLSYADLYRDSMTLAKHLKKDYIQGKQSKIAIIGRNHLDTVKSIFAVSRAGADVFMLNVEIRKEQFDKLCQRFKFGLVILDDDLENLKDGLDMKALSMSSISELSKNTVKFKLPKAFGGKLTVLTGGSTGDPKAASRKPSISAYFNPFSALLEKVQLDRYKSVYVGTPVYHGFGVATVFAGMALGANLYMRRKFIAADACKLVEEHKIEVLTLVPLMLKRMIEYNSSHLASVQAYLTGGAPLGPDVIMLSQEKIGDKLFNLYGTSEAGFCIMASPQDLRRELCTIGKPVKGVKLFILDNDNKPVKGTDTGKLCVKAGWSVNKSAYIETGDLAYRDEHGFIFLKGRSDDMIVSGGENVYPLELENILLQHPDTEQVAVFGIEDSEFGQRLKAVVSTRNNIAIDEAELRAWLKPRCTRYQMPKVIEFKSIEFSELGKINKKNL
jgi:acyl-CoA synthetase (AMP-forming)/AMP-acid ligase II